MKIAVFGAGGVGAFFGGLLVRGGADVHFVARGPQLEALQTTGMLIRSPRLGDVVVPHVRAESDAAASACRDLVLVCVKAHQTPEILDDLAALVGAANDPGDAAERRRLRRATGGPLWCRAGGAGVVYVGATTRGTRGGQSCRGGNDRHWRARRRRPVTARRLVRPHCGSPGSR